MLFVFSNRIFLKSEDWGFFSLKLFKIGPWHKASLPIPFCCPPAIHIFFNDNYNVSFADVQFIHVLKGDRERKCGEPESTGGPKHISGGLGFFYPAFPQQSTSVLRVGKEPAIPDNERLSTY